MRCADSCHLSSLGSRHSKPSRRPRISAKARTMLPDSTADAQPLIEEEFGRASTASAGRSLAAHASQPPTRRAPPRVGEACLSAGQAAAVAAAQLDPTPAALSGSCPLLPTALHAEPPPFAAVLSQAFGFSAFRDGQLGAIGRILAGNACFAILPTGQGKSLCYQARALNMIPQ